MHDEGDGHIFQIIPFSKNIHRKDADEGGEKDTKESGCPGDFAGGISGCFHAERIYIEKKQIFLNRKLAFTSNILYDVSYPQK